MSVYSKVLLNIFVGYLIGSSVPEQLHGDNFKMVLYLSMVALLYILILNIHECQLKKDSINE